MRKTKWISALGCLSLTAGLLLSQPSVVALADGEGGSSLAGISFVLDEYVANEDSAEETLTEFVTATGYGGTVSVDHDFAISHVDDYINVRSSPSTESEVIGKIYDQAGVTILEGTGDGNWYHIKSGSVDGYAQSQFFVVGEEAQE